MKDLMNKITPKRVISPVSVADTTAQVGQIIDKKGFDSVTYVILTGSIADADASTRQKCRPMCKSSKLKRK